MDEIQEDREYNSMILFLTEQQTILYEIQLELKQQQEYKEKKQKYNNCNIEKKNYDEQEQNEIFKISQKLNSKDIKSKKLKITNLILTTQAQIQIVRNEVTQIRKLQAFNTQVGNDNQQSYAQQVSKQLKKNKKKISKRDKQSLRYDLELQQIQEVIVLKEFHENQKSILFIKPDQHSQFDQYQSDSDLEHFYKQNFFPTQQVNYQLRVDSNQSLALIQLDSRSQLYSQLKPQIDSFTQQQNLNNSNKNFPVIHMQKQIIDNITDQQQKKNFDKKKYVKLFRFFNIIDHFYKKQAILNIKNVNNEVCKNMNFKLKGIQSEMFAYQDLNQVKDQQNQVQIVKKIDQRRLLRRYIKQTYDNQKDLIQTQLKQKKFQCQKCLRYYKNREGLIEHYINYHIL